MGHGGKMGLNPSHCLYLSIHPFIRPSHHLVVVVSVVRLSELRAAFLLAVVVKLALPVHHVGGPAVELHLPLTLRLVDVVWAKKQGKEKEVLSHGDQLRETETGRLWL